MGSSSAHPANEKIRQVRNGGWFSYLAWILGSGILLLVLTILGMTAASLTAGEDARSPRASALSVRVIPMRQQPNYQVKRVYVGRMEPARESAVGLERAGKVQSISVDEGMRVKQGEILARLDVERLHAQRAELVAALNQARANLALAKITLDRQQGLVEAGAISRQDLDEAEENQHALKAAVELAKARIGTVDVELRKSKLTAPFNAIVTGRLVDEGQVLAVGQPVLQLQEDALPEARVGVAGTMVETLAVGQPHKLLINGRTASANVKAILPFRGAATRTVDALFRLHERLEDLRSGDLVKLLIEQTIDEPGYWMPVTALAEGTRGLWSSYVAQPIVAQQSEEGVGATHELTRRTIEILHEETDRVFVRGTLEEGDLVVADGLHRVVPGQLVQLYDNPATAIARKEGLGDVVN